MKHLRIGARLLLLLAIVTSGLLGAVAPGRALAQGATSTFISPMTGIPITTSGVWTVDPTSVYAESGVESVTLEGQYEFMQVWFMPAGVPLIEARDVVLDSFAQTFGTFVEIDRGAYGNVSYSLDITSTEGIEFGVFSLFLGQRDSGYVEYYVLFAELSLFAQAIASAQQNVTVNGISVFGGVDGVGLQNLLLQNAGVTGGTTTTTQPPATQPTPPPQTEQPQQPTTPTQPPATTGQPSTTSPEGDAYLAALEAEAVYLETTVGDFLNAYMSMESNGEAAVQEMSRIAQEWANYPQRAAAITAPAGYETLHAQYQQIVGTVEGLATEWNAVVTSAQAADGTSSSKLAMLVLSVTGLQLDIEDLRAAMATASGSAPSTTTTTTEQPTQAPSDPTTQTTAGLNAEQMAYVQTVRSEIAMLETSMDDFQASFTSYLEGTAPDPDQAIQDINAAVQMWSAYPQTAAGIIAPAGMEDVDAAYQGIASSISGAAGTFNSAIQAGANGDTAGSQSMMETFIDEFSGVYTQIDSLNALLDQYESAGAPTTGSTTTTQPTQPPADPPAQPTAEPQPTQETTTTTTGDPGDGDAYVNTILGETGAIMDSIVMFAEGADLLGSTDQAEKEQGAQKINDALAFWGSYDQTAAGIVAPAGFEDVDAAYRQLASDVTQLATLFDAWINGPETSSQAAADEFSAMFDSVQDQIQALEAMVGAPSTGSASAEPTADAGQVEEDITETGNRGQLPQFDDQQGTGSSDQEELGLVSDTEYVSPQYDIEVVWDDRWAFDAEVTDEPIGSDEENGEDWITLVWTSGDAGDITVSLLEIDGFTTDQMVEYWESDEYLEEFSAPGEVVLAEASDDRGAVLIVLDDGEGGVAIYREAVCVSRACDEVALIMVVAPVVDAPDLIADAEEGIEIDGEPATGMFSMREINRALDQ